MGGSVAEVKLYSVMARGLYQICCVNYSVCNVNNTILTEVSVGFKMPHVGKYEYGGSV